MKKINYLMIVLFSVVLMATSCKKDSTEPVTPLITLSQLNGTWNFVNFQYDSLTYTVPLQIELSANDSVKNSNSLLTLVFTVSTGYAPDDGVVDFDSYKFDATGNYFKLNTTKNIITVGDEGLAWQILNNKPVTDTLVLKCIGTAGIAYLVNGILTVTKQ